MGGGGGGERGQEKEGGGVVNRVIFTFNQYNDKIGWEVEDTSATNVDLMVGYLLCLKSVGGAIKSKLARKHC